MANFIKNGGQQAVEINNYLRRQNSVNTPNGGVPSLSPLWWKWISSHSYNKNKYAWYVLVEGEILYMAAKFQGFTPMHTGAVIFFLSVVQKC